MYTVEIKNPCSCSIKRAMQELQEFDTAQEAEEEANKIFDIMNNEFCKKHNFELKNEYGNFVIYIRPN